MEMKQSTACLSLLRLQNLLWPTVILLLASHSVLTAHEGYPTYKDGLTNEDLSGMMRSMPEIQCAIRLLDLLQSSCRIVGSAASRKGSVHQNSFAVDIVSANPDACFYPLPLLSHVCSTAVVSDGGHQPGFDSGYRSDLMAARYRRKHNFSGADAGQSDYPAGFFASRGRRAALQPRDKREARYDHATSKNRHL